MSDFVLYNAKQSTCSQRVRFILNAKGIAFEERILDLMSGDQTKPDYLALNPNGLVPTLVHKGEPVTDSSVILEYVDEVVPEPVSFTPVDPLARARMRSMMHYIDEVPAASIRVPTYNLAFLPNFQKMSEEEFLAVANSKPLRKEFMLTMGRTGFSEAEFNSALDRLGRAVARIDSWIEKSGGPWFMGETMTLSDICVMPEIVRLRDINLDTMWADKPNVAHWLDHVRAHPAFEKTYYPGSLLSEMYPHLGAKWREERAAQ